VVALTRCNLWRAMDRIGADVLGHARKAGGAPDGRYPVAIDRDNVFYPSDDPDPASARPGAMRYDETGMKLGHFKPSTSLPSRKITTAERGTR